MRLDLLLEKAFPDATCISWKSWAKDYDDPEKAWKEYHHGPWMLYPLEKAELIPPFPWMARHIVAPALEVASMECERIGDDISEGALMSHRNAILKPDNGDMRERLEDALRAAIVIASRIGERGDGYVARRLPVAADVLGENVYCAAGASVGLTGAGMQVMGTMAFLKHAEDRALAALSMACEIRQLHPEVPPEVLALLYPDGL